MLFPILLHIIAIEIINTTTRLHRENILKGVFLQVLHKIENKEDIYILHLEQEETSRGWFISPKT